MRKLFLALILLIAFALPSFGADRYLVGTGNRNTNDTANWSATSGGAGGQSVPTTGDAAIADSNSGLTGVTITVNAAFIPDSFTYTGGAAKTNIISLGANVTVSGAFTVISNSVVNRVLIASNTIGTARTISAGSIGASTASVDFRDITGAGAASWDLSAITGGSGNAGGNTGITFSTPQTNYYYKASGNDNVSTVGNWFLGTGGTGGAGRVPLPQDNPMRFDAGSFGAAGMVVTQDMPRFPGWDFTGATNNPTMTPSTVAEFYNSITNISAMTLTASTQAYTYSGRGAAIIVSAGKTWAKIITVNAKDAVGSLTLQDAFQSTTAIYSISGTLVASDVSVTVDYTGPTLLSTIRLGSGLWSLSYATGAWSASDSSTVNASTGTIKYTSTSASTKVFTGGGKNYNNLQFSGGAGGGSYVLTGTNTFVGEIYDDGTAAHTVTWPNVTTTVGNIRRAADTNIITWQRTGGSGTATIAVSGGGAISLDYMSISNVNCTPVGRCYAGIHSTDGGGTTGWVFAAPPSSGGRARLRR